MHENNYQPPTDAEQAKNLYITLRQYFHTNL